MLILPVDVRLMSLTELKVSADLAVWASSLVVEVALNNSADPDAVVDSDAVDTGFKDGIDALNVVNFRFLSLAIVMSPAETMDV